MVAASRPAVTRKHWVEILHFLLEGLKLTNALREARFLFFGRGCAQLLPCGIQQDRDVRLR
jgi:hypothetical protein